MALTLSREKYRRLLSSAGGGDKPSRLLLYSYGSGDKSLRLPLSSVWGGDFADVGGIGIGIGIGIVIVQIWFGSPVDSDDGSALDPSIDGGGSDRRGGQIASVGGGKAWWRADRFVFCSIFSLYSDDGGGAGGCLWFMTAEYLVFDGGGGTLSRGGGGFWLESDPLGVVTHGGGGGSLHGCDGVREVPLPISPYWASWDDGEGKIVGEARVSPKLACWALGFTQLGPWRWLILTGCWAHFGSPNAEDNVVVCHLLLLF